VNTTLRRLLALSLLACAAVGGSAHASDRAGAAVATPDPVVDLDAIDDELARLEAAGDPSVRIQTVQAHEAAVAPNGAVTFEHPGTFLEPRAGDSYVAFDLPLRNNVRYRHATVEFDLYFDRWQSPLFHGIFSLRRTGERRDRTLYVGLILRGSKGYKSILDVGINPRSRRGEIIRSDTGPWREQTLFHVRTDYDIPKRKVILQVFEDGQLVHVLSGRINSTDLSPRGRKVRVDFGGTGIAHSAYFPPYGSSYSDLSVRITP
jgi:hypothetical protein